MDLQQIELKLKRLLKKKSVKKFSKTLKPPATRAIIHVKNNIKLLTNILTLVCNTPIREIPSDDLKMIPLCIRENDKILNEFYLFLSTISNVCNCDYPYKNITLDELQASINTLENLSIKDQ